MRKKITLIVYGALTAFLPAFALAAPRDFKEFMGQIIQLIDGATLLLFAVAIMIFFWNVLYNLWGYDGGNAEQKARMNTVMFWGVIIIFVMVSIWGIIQILQETLTRGLS